MRSAPARILQFTPSVRPGVRLPEIDRLKGFALVLVLAYHLGGAAGWGNWAHGEAGVDIFLIASGFILAVGSVDLPGGEFVRRRFLRIFPGYWAALALFLLLNARYFGDHRSPADIGLHLVGLHGFADPRFFSAINDSFWFISAIILLYGAFFCLRRHLHDFALVAGVGALLTAALRVFYQETGNRAGLIELAVRVPSAFLGFLAGQLASGRPMEIRFTPILAAGLLAATYLVAFTGAPLGYPVAATALIVLFLAAGRRLERYHSGRAGLAVFSFFGVYSYEIYLLHQPLIRDYNLLVLAHWGVPSPGAGLLWASRAVALALVIGASVPIHRAVNFLFRRRRGPVPVGLEMAVPR